VADEVLLEPVDCEVLVESVVPRVDVDDTTVEDPVDVGLPPPVAREVWENVVPVP
jgi:hypothetical protein